MKARLIRAALRLVPREWRPAVAADVTETASMEHHGTAWAAWQAARVGVRMRTAVAFDNARFDTSYALRSLAKARGFAGAAVLIFALGIGVNVAVFTAVDRALFRELPYDHPGDLVVMREVDGSGQAFGTLPASIVAEARRRHSAFVDLSVSGFTRIFALDREGDSGSELRLTAATHNTLELFGVGVLRGRDFTAEDATSKARVALISFDAWRRRFGGAGDIVGRRIYDPQGSPIEIVGVLPEPFIAPSSFINPLSDGLVLDPDTFTNPAPGARSFPAYVRLESGSSLDAAQTELDVLVKAIQRDQPESSNASPAVIRLVPLERVLFEHYVDYLWLIAAAAALLLAVACANLGSLLLVRHESRAHLAAAQIALGASRARLVRTGLIESLLLSGAGTAVSLLVIGWSDAALRAALPPVFGRYAAGIADGRVLTFALATAVLCTVVAGAYPSWRVSRVDVLQLLQGGHRSSSRSRRRLGGRTWLVVEAALAVILVAGAAFTVRSFATLARTDLGFEPNNLHTLSVNWPRGIDPATQFQHARLVIQALHSAPNVMSAAAVDVNPLSGARSMDALGPGLKGTSRWRVSPEFFDAMTMSFVAGRPISPAEAAGDATVGVLSESGLRLVWPGLGAREAIGKMLSFPGQPDRVIVGVVGDLRSSHAQAPTPSLYVPLTSHQFRRADFIFRVAEGHSPLIADIRHRIRETGVPATAVTMGDVSQGLQRGLADQQFRALLFSAFGLTALLLAAVGLYAVGAYEVRRREREMGIRLAVGGSTGGVQWLVIRQTMAPVLIGVIAGLLGTYWAASYLQSFLHQVDSRDPATLAAVVIVLLASAALAAWLPARRIVRLDPVAVLRAR